jgi:hypothetical protein
MAYLDERWQTMKTALLKFLNPIPISNNDKDVVLKWINNVIEGQFEADIEAALDSLHESADALADPDYPKSKKVLRWVQGAAARGIDGAVLRISHKADQSKLGSYHTRTDKASKAGMRFVDALRGDKKKPAFVERNPPSPSSAKNGLRGKPTTDPSSFWPSSYISSTSTSGGGKSPKDKPKKQASKKAAAVKTPAKKKAARKAARR